MKRTLIRTVGAQFKYDDPEFYGKIIPAIKHIDSDGETTYEFGDGAYIGYPPGSKYSEYEVIEVDPFDEPRED